MESGVRKGRNWHSSRSCSIWGHHGEKSHLPYDSGAEKPDFMAPKRCPNIVYCLYRGIFFNKRTPSFFPINTHRIHYFRALGTSDVCLDSCHGNRTRKAVLQLSRIRTTVLAILHGYLRFPRFPWSSSAFSDCYNVTSVHFSHNVFICLRKIMFFLPFLRGLERSRAVTIMWGFHILRERKKKKQKNRKNPKQTTTAITKILVTIFTFNR